MQENENGDIGQLMFECEIPMNFNFEKLTDRFTSISYLDSGEFFGLYFTKSVGDCMSFNMHIGKLNETLTTDMRKYKAI